MLAIQPTANIGWYFDGQEEAAVSISLDMIPNVETVGNFNLRGYFFMAANNASSYYGNNECTL
ncbi:MAG: hypothetical protein LBG52_00675 [Candidatus Peribacteria bacterium]|nr:hypothetical protein [Candidatus Peribacteria bacterium]